MARLSDIARSGIRAEDLPDLPEETKRGLEPLLRYLNASIQSIAAAFAKGISISANMQTETQTVSLSHGVPQLVSLKVLKQAKGIRSIGVGTADGRTQYMLAAPLHVIATNVPNQVKVLAYFTDTAAKRVPVTFELTPEGSYSALTPTAPLASDSLDPAGPLNLGTVNATAVNVGHAGVPLKTADVENAGNLALGTDGTTQPVLGSTAKPAQIPAAPSGVPNNTVHGMNVIKAWASIKIVQSGTAGAGGRTVTSTAFGLSWSFSGKLINFTFTNNMTNGDAGYVILAQASNYGRTPPVASTAWTLIAIGSQVTTGFTLYMQQFHGGTSQWIEIDWGADINFSAEFYVAVIGQS